MSKSWGLQQWSAQPPPPLRPPIPFGLPALLPRPRSVGPVALPWLGAFSAAPFDMRQQALAQILPRFPLHHLTTPYDFNNIINPWVRTNPEVVPNLWNALPQDGLRRAVHLVLGAVAASSPLNAVDDFCQRLLAELELALREDTRYSMRQGSLSVSQRSQHMFRSFAEISHSCHSPLLGDVLRDFFLTHVRHLAEYDSPRSLAQWCHSIMRSFMATEDKDLCLIKLLEYRPGLIDELELEHGVRLRRVKDYLVDLADASGRSSMMPRSPRLGYSACYIDDSNDPYNGNSLDPLELDDIERCENRANFHLSEAWREEDKAHRIGAGMMRGRPRSPRDHFGYYGFGHGRVRLSRRTGSLSPSPRYGARFFRRARSSSLDPWRF